MLRAAELDTSLETEHAKDVQKDVYYVFQKQNVLDAKEDHTYILINVLKSALLDITDQTENA